MPKFHLSLRTRKELSAAYILNKPGVSGERCVLLTLFPPLSISPSLRHIWFRWAPWHSMLWDSQTQVLSRTVVIAVTPSWVPTVCTTLCCGLTDFLAAASLLTVIPNSTMRKLWLRGLLARKVAEPGFEGHLHPRPVCFMHNYLYEDLVVEYLFGKGRQKGRSGTPSTLVTDSGSLAPRTPRLLSVVAVLAEPAVLRLVWSGAWIKWRPEPLQASAHTGPEEKALSPMFRRHAEGI